MTKRTKLTFLKGLHLTRGQSDSDAVDRSIPGIDGLGLDRKRRHCDWTRS